MAAPEEEPPEGAPDWIVTFTDLTSLLVTFFVLLMTFSSFEPTEREVMVIKGIQMLGHEGVIAHKNGPTAVRPPDNDRLNAVDPLNGADSTHHRPQQHLLENMDEMGQKKSPEDVELNLNVKRDGLHLRFGPEAQFQPGSARINTFLEGGLIDLARVSEFYPNLLVIEGHTDDAFTPNAEYASADDLSLARAAAAAELMLANSNLSPHMVQIAAVGSKSPAQPNDTPEGRAANRRVEVRIVALSKSRAQKLELLEEGR